MKTKQFLFTVLSFSFVFAFAQNNIPTQGHCKDPALSGSAGGAPIPAFIVSDMRDSPTNQVQTLGTKGSPFLVENFEKSTIYVNDDLLGTFYSRYNAFSQEIEIKRTHLAEEEHKALIKDETIRVVFDDKEIKYTSFIDEKGKVTEDYLIAMVSGANYNLYQRYTVKFVEGKEAANSMVSSVPNRFTGSSSHYLKDLSTSVVSYLPTKKSQLLKVFKDGDRIQLTSLIKKKGLNIKKESDLVTLINFANALDQKNYAMTKGK